MSIPCPAAFAHVRAGNPLRRPPPSALTNSRRLMLELPYERGPDAGYRIGEDQSGGNGKAPARPGLSLTLCSLMHCRLSHLSDRSREEMVPKKEKAPLPLTANTCHQSVAVEQQVSVPNGNHGRTQYCVDKPTNEPLCGVRRPKGMNRFAACGDPRA
jgi:hypothetical protein